MEITIEQLKKFCYVLIACFAVFMTIWEVFYNTNQDRYERSLKDIMHDHYNGVVVKKYIDGNNHNSPMLVFSDKKQIAMFDQFYAIIQIGDSVVKEKASTKILVYRNNSKFILDNKDVLKEMIK